MILSLFALQEILFCVRIFAAKEDSRLAYVITRENKQLLGHVVKRFESRGLISCSQSCLRNPWCTSTNFKDSSNVGDKGTCELNKNELAPINEDTKLIDRSGLPIYKLSHVTTFNQNEGICIPIRQKQVHSWPATDTDIWEQRGCLKTGCFSDGSCLFDEKTGTFTCSCRLPWSGDKCEVKIDVHFHFTTLGARGRFGPTSNAQYQGTSLEGILVQNGLQTWNVPVTGQYHLELCGATGADFSGLNTKGGRGAKVEGDIHLEQGTQLTVLVGQQATGGGGGGGTFVVFAADGRPLAIAGGGGSADIVDGDPGQAGELGSVNGGGKGKGEKVCMSGGSDLSLIGVGGGGGLMTNGCCFEDGKCNKPCPGGEGRKSFSAGGEGGYNKKARCAGGFGGGGKCGGGGGYSGGGVQVDGRSKNLDLHAGGGGSFLPDNNWTVLSGNCLMGNGFALFEIVSLDF